ncbi:hypothetical protein RN001_004605 [Aquatica leii]|uniref:Regulatory protein zeste n=1 Tax=Aquatica leii TaxID=1421715 RepID=A0AAN7PIM1_9COLE|nr:hypothetical protein RN001_004605 [Aquatica leii]
MDKVKRERTVNFTELEVRVLIDIALRYSFIIENKKTDAVSWKDKNKAWENIATEFNPVTGCINRVSKVLRLKYDNIKPNIKQKQSKNKYEIFKTGGGAAVILPFTDYEKKLMNVVQLSVDGLPSEGDSDHILTASSNSGLMVYENDNDLFEYIVEQNVTFMEQGQQLSCSAEHSEYCKTKWKSWNPQQLKRKVHKSLSGTPRTSGSVTKNSLNNKIDGLTNSRIELIKLQKEIAETEIKCKKGQQGILENEECRRTEEHLQVMSNLNLQHEILLDLHERHKTESNLRQELLLLQIQNQKLEIATKQKRL